MSRPLRIEFSGAFYHITSRGNERKEIFKSRRDREKFLEYLASATARYGAVVHCYCLMDTHYHLLLETPQGNLSQIMRHINGAYTTYYNVKRQRVGHLFQGRYKGILVEADSYAAELSRYIHLNPVRAGIVQRPEEYEWSSHRSYIESQAPGWLRQDLVLGLFAKETAAARQRYTIFVEELIGAEYESPLNNVAASTVLGSPKFVEEIIEQYIDVRELDENLTGFRHLVSRPKCEDIEKKVAALLTRQRELIKDVSVHCCKKFSGCQLKDIGEYFGKSAPAISQVSHRLAVRAEKDEGLRALLSSVEAAFKKGSN